MYLNRTPLNFKLRLVTRFILLFLLFLAVKANGQAEVEAWGNISGMRKHGQLYGFETLINVISTDGRHFKGTGKERQRPKYHREGDSQVINTNIDSLYINEVVKDNGNSKLKVSVTITAHADLDFKGVYFCLLFHNSAWLDGKLKFSGTGDRALRHLNPADNNHDETADGIEFKSAAGNLKIGSEGPVRLMIRRDTSGGRHDLQLYIPIKETGIKQGETITAAYTIKVSGKADDSPVHLSVDANRQGRPFAGLGGNFRLQNPATDPQVIDYCLRNLRVAFGRVELPWRWWQPDLNTDPVLTADSGKLKREVVKDMQMAKRLDSLGIPYTLSAWFPPQWAVVGHLNNRPVNGVWGNALDAGRMDTIYKSIAGYILYLRQHYHTEPRYFSFNESDLGINVRLTAQEHDDFIKGCGAYFQSHGITTKMLLGDNSDATTYSFIEPALNDPAAKPYIGAVSFHSWRGWDEATLKHWADAASGLGVPLLVSEGSIDAAAYSYPDIFQEPAYALNEINLYIRLLKICQPESILQWQLTADYSPLIGGGIFNNNEALHPGQRFWNLKQLSITPENLPALGSESDKPGVTFAALGDTKSAKYAFHIVNNGSKRKALLTGLPAGLSSLKYYKTSKTDSFKQAGSVKVKNGTAGFRMDAASYITLISE